MCIRNFRQNDLCFKRVFMTVIMTKITYIHIRISVVYTRGLNDSESDRKTWKGPDGTLSGRWSLPFRSLISRQIESQTCLSETRQKYHIL